MKIHKYIVLLAVAFFSVSCSDVLDQAPGGKVSLEEVFQNNEYVQAYLNTCYRYMPVYGDRYFFWSRGPVCWSDEAWDADDLDVNWAGSALLYNGSATASSHPVWNSDNNHGGNMGNFWTNYFAMIRNCSYFITHIDDAIVSSETNRNRWRAEAHLLRAFYYSELLRWFGCGLPIIREPYDFDQDFSSVTRSSYYEVVKFIIEDCDVALASSELPWRITTSSEERRVTKALAEAIKARMILYAASPLYNEGNDYWQEAYNITKQSLENLRNNGYELYKQLNIPNVYYAETAYVPNEYAALYHEYFCESAAYSATPSDKETIYQTADAQGNIWNIDGIGAQDGYKTGTCPSQELVDSYETIDGQPILNLEKPYQDEETHLIPNYNQDNTLYDPQNPYENRDPRFYASIYYNGSKRYAYWQFEEEPGCYENYPAPMGNRTRIIATWVGEPKTGTASSGRAVTRTGYYERKFLHPTCGNNNTLVGARFKAFRLAEVILNFAEAACEANHLDEARDAVNEIRARVGMPELPTTLSKDQLRLRIHNERRVELALEGFRYFDVRRWSKPDGDLAKTDRWVTAAKITRNEDGSYTYGRMQVNGNERQCYTNKYLKVAIPLNEVNNVLAITGENWQNPGW